MTEFIDPLGRGPKIVARPPSPPPQPPPNFSSPMDTKFRPTMDAKPMFPDAAFERDQRVPPPPPPSQQQQHHHQALSRGPPPPSASMASSSQYYPPVQQQWSGQTGSNHGSGGDFPPRSNLGNRLEEDVVPPSPMQIYLDRQQRSHPSASFDRSAGSSSARENTNLGMDGRAQKIMSSSNISSQYPNQHGSYQPNNNYQENGNDFRDQRDFSSHPSHSVPASSFDRNSIQPSSSRPPAANDASLQSPPPSNYFPSDRPHHPSHPPHSHPQGQQPHPHPQRESYYDRDDPTRRLPDGYHPPSSSIGNRNHHHDVPSRNGFESPPLPPATSRSVPPPTSRSAPLHDGHPYRGPHSATNRSHPDARYYHREYGEPGPPPSPPPLSERNDRSARLPGAGILSYGDSYNRESGHVSNTNYGYRNGPIDDDRRGNGRFGGEGRGDGSGNYGDSDPYRGGDGYDARRAPSEDRFRSPPVPARDDFKREYPPREFDRPPPLNSRSREDYYGAEYDRQRDPMHPHHPQPTGSFDSKLPRQDHRHRSEYRHGIDERNYSGHVDERYRYDNGVQSNRHNDDRGRAPSPHVIDPTPLPPPQPPISPLTTATFCGTFADDYLPKSSCHSRDYDDREPNHRQSSSVDPYRGIARDRVRESDRRSPYSDFACAPGDMTSAEHRATTRGVTDPRHYPHRRHDGGPRDYIEPSHSREQDFHRPKGSFVKHYETDHTQGIPKQVLAYQGQPSYSDHRSSRPDKRDDFSESSVQTHSSTSGRQGPTSSDTYHHQHSHEHCPSHPHSHQHDDFDNQDKPHLRIEIPASPNLPNGNRVRQDNYHNDVRSNSRSMESKPYTSNTNPRSQSQSHATKQTIHLPPKSPRVAMANEERHQSEARHQIMKEIRQATNMRNSALDEDDRRFWDRQIATLNESFKKL